MRYQLIVRFNDDTADKPTADRYYEFLRRYKTIGIGNNDGTSVVRISSERELTEKVLAEFLGRGIPIISLVKQDKV